MRATLLLVFSLFLNLVGFSQSSIFHENFESPSLADSVTSTGTPAWAVTTAFFSDGLRSYTNVVPSSGGSSFATNSFNASTSSNVILQFAHICKIEFGDSAFIEVSINGGTSWIQLTGAHYQGSGLFGGWGNRFSAASYATDWDASNSNTAPTYLWWKSETFDISAIAANQANVKVRFRLADGSIGLPGAGGAYGWVIDNIRVNGAISELIPPVVTLNTPILQDTVYGTGPFTVSATCTDASGIAQAKLVYWLNSGNHDTLNMTKSGNIYTANIPSMSYNNKVYYYVYAVDSSLSANTTQTSTMWFFNKKGPSVYIVGTGTSANTSTGYPAPYTNYYGGAKHQMLIKASELIALGATAGPISSVGFYVSSVGTTFTGSLNSFRIDIGTTANSVMSSSSFVSGLINVFPAATVPIVVGLNTHTFTTPFVWDGISNIVIQTSYSNANSGTSTDGVIMFNSDPGFISTNYYRADGSTAAAILSATTPTGAVNARPNMKISMLSTSYAYDAGIFQIIEPTGTIYTTSATPVKVSVKNFGTDTLKKVTIGWTVDGVAQTNAIWTGSLLQDVSSTSFTIGNYSFTSGAHTIRIWTKLPNDSNDLNKLNDTLVKSIYVCNGTMAGTYTVGGSSANYNTLNAALNQLNTCGVSGPVTLLINGGTYSGSYEINGNIPGSSLTNTITIKPASGQTVLFTDSTATGLATFKLTKTKFVILDGSNTSNGTSRDMTFENRSAATNTAAIWLSSMGISNGNEDIIIKNCNIKAGSNTVTSTFGIYAAGTTISTSGTGEDNDRISLLNNSVKRSYIGIYARGTTTAPLNNLNVSGNEIGSSIASDYIQYRGLDLAELSLGQINKNRIFNIQTSSSINVSAIELGIGVTTTEVTKNIIYGLRSTSSGGYGAYGVNVSGSTASDILIANNFMYDFITANYSTTSTTWNPFGIRLIAGSNIRVYNNSIYFYGSPTSGTSASMSACLLITTALNGIEIKNNIFENTMTGVSGSKHYCMYSPSGVSFTSLDYNDYYAAGIHGFVGYYGADKQAFADWKLATTKDTNSVNINPNFLSLSDLHTINININNLGTPVVGVTTDIDNEIRSTSNPDMGADEFTPPANDAAVLNIDPNFNNCVGSNPLVVKIKNNGLNTLQSVKIDWTINGVAQTQIICC